MTPGKKNLLANAQNAKNKALSKKAELIIHSKSFTSATRRQVAQRQRNSLQKNIVSEGAVIRNKSQAVLVPTKQQSPYKVDDPAEQRNSRKQACTTAETNASNLNEVRPKIASYGQAVSTLNNQGRSRPKFTGLRKSVEAPSSMKRISERGSQKLVKIKSRPLTAV